MRGVNKVMLLGYVGNDPELKTSQSGTAYCRLRLATTESRLDKGSGERTDETTWHNIVAFGKQAELLGEYVRKGLLLHVEGRIQTRAYEDKQSGSKHTSTSILLDRFVMGDRPDNGASGGGQSRGDAPSGGGQQQPPRQQPRQDDMLGDTNTGGDPDIPWV